MTTTLWEWQEQDLREAMVDVSFGGRTPCIVPVSGGMHSAALFSFAMDNLSSKEVPIPLHIIDASRDDASRATKAFWRICDTTADPWDNLCKFTIVLHAAEEGKLNVSSVTELAQRIAKVVGKDARVLSWESLCPSQTRKNVITTQFAKYLIKAIDPQTWSQRGDDVLQHADWDHDHVEVLDMFNVCPQSTDALAREVGPFAHVCPNSTCMPCVRALRLVARATDGCLVENSDSEEETQNVQKRACT